MKKENTTINFGKRLAKLRKAKGLTQQQLGDKIGASRRVVAYYEGETDYPPAHLIAPLSKALGLSADELLGITKTKDTLDDQLSAVWRRLKVLEGFSEKDRKAVIHYVEVIAQKNKAEQKATDKRQ